MENKLLIPICIPTCNRYEHLKRCVESLSKCTLASETDLIISVDYPPSDKYVDGNEKIKKWLERGIEGFKSVQIFFRKRIWEHMIMEGFYQDMLLINTKASLFWRMIMS